MPKRTKRIASVKSELIQKSREAMLTSVQIFNNPNIQFKSESFIVLSIISWTYLLHAYYRSNGIEYRYFEQRKTKRIFDRTKQGAYKYWELERCLNNKKSPIDQVTATNLRFLIGLRHEIEHQMTTRIDDLLSARFQACCLNYNLYLKKLFPKVDSIEKYLSFSLQFSSLNEKQMDQLNEYDDLPINIASYIEEFDQALGEEDFNDSKFSYRVLFIPKTANRKGHADRVIEFVDPKSEIAKGLSKEYWTFKDREKQKYKAGTIVKEMKRMGYKKFSQHFHTQLWKREDAKDPGKGFGILVEGYWYWYENWLKYVAKHCQENKSFYT